MTVVQKQIRLWLLVCAGMVLVMIGLGGYTRLSGSGLSIVDWKPLIGAIPPLSEASWLEVFDRYQQFPEYQKVNASMSLSEFKFIYLVEYFHRLWGRAMGLALLIPTLFALFKYRHALPKILGIWGLALAQGAMGWYMVKSGLVDDPHVSPYRLTAHLLLALVILGYILRTVNSLKSPSETESSNLNGKFLALNLILGLTICFGGLTAGTHAGWIYNTFPDMNGHFMPEEIFTMQPVWKDLVANPATIQFTHRLFAFFSLALGFYVFLSSRSHDVTPKIKHVSAIIAGALTLQVLLGVITLVLQVPVWLGVIHQMWASVVFGASFWGYLLTRKQPMGNQVALGNT